MTILCLIVSKIIRITLNMAAIFLNGFQNGGYKGIMYSAILFSDIYAPQNLNRVEIEGSALLSF